MADQPVGDIIKDITEDVKLLVRDEMELAKSELIPAAKNGGIGAGLFGAAGYFGICAPLVLYFAARLRSGRRFGLPLLGRLPDRRPALLLVVAGNLRGPSATAGSRRSRPRSGPSPRPTRPVAERQGPRPTRALAAAKAPQIEGTVVNQNAALFADRPDRRLMRRR